MKRGWRLRDCPGPWAITFCLLGGISGAVACAAVIGVAMPKPLHGLDREPQVAAGPISLALTDRATLLIYFILARALLA